MLAQQQYTHEKPMLTDGQTEPGLVAFYDIRPGNRAGLFLPSWSQDGVNGNEVSM